jgi:uncharacterized protein (DUF1778 family)
MAKTRLTISLDRELADRIRAYAERAGMDVSSFVLSGAVQQMSIADRAETQHAQLNAARAGS